MKKVILALAILALGGTSAEAGPLGLFGGGRCPSAQTAPEPRFPRLHALLHPFQQQGTTDTAGNGSVSAAPFESLKEIAGRARSLLPSFGGFGCPGGQCGR